MTEPFSVDSLLATRHDFAKTELTDECERFLAGAREDAQRAGKNLEDARDKELERLLRQLIWADFLRDTEIVRQSLKEHIQDVLISMLGDLARNSSPPPQTNRDIVERLRRAIPNCVELAGSEPALLELFADAILQTSVNGAASATENSERSTDTVSLHNSVETTLAFADRNPKALLARSESLARLREWNPLAARIYLLSQFAGQSSAEIARLLELPEEEAGQRLHFAITEITIEG